MQSTVWALKRWGTRNEASEDVLMEGKTLILTLLKTQSRKCQEPRPRNLIPSTAAVVKTEKPLSQLPAVHMTGDVLISQEPVIGGSWDYHIDKANIEVLFPPRNQFIFLKTQPTLSSTTQFIKAHSHNCNDQLKSRDYPCTRNKVD